MYNFEKPLYLPSGGFKYSPYVWIKPLTKELIFFELDVSGYDSMLEYIMIIIKNCVTMSNDFLDLYINDLFYIWMHLLSTDINKSTETIEIHQCSYCSSFNKILIDFAELNYNILNQYDNNLKDNYEFSKNEITIKFSLRNIKDALFFQTINLYNDNKTIRNIIFYLVSQIIELKFQNEIISKNEYVSFLENRFSHEILYFYYELNKINNLFGVEKRIKFKCTSCQKINYTMIFNDMLYSIIPSSTKNAYNNQFQFIKYVMNFAQTHSLTANEFFNFPLRFDSVLNDVLNISKVQQGSIFTIYNDGIRK